MIKTIVYVDGFNLYYRLKNTPHKWLNLKKLVERLLKKEHQISKIKYFTARVKSSKKDLHKIDRQDIYWRALKTIPKLEIIEGRFKSRDIKGRFLRPLGKGIRKGEIVKIKKYEEKESDVNIASHIVFDCIQKENDCIVLVSNDTDLKTPLFIARKHFRKTVGVISPNKYTHHDLKRISRFNINISDEDLAKSQFPEKIDKISKPPSW